MDGAAVIAAYHDLWQVEASFRMTKHDLKARPIFHHEREAIEAHLTVVFAALAISRDLQQRSGVTIKKLVQTLRTARSATIEINGRRCDPRTQDRRTRAGDPQPPRSGSPSRMSGVRTDADHC